MQKKLKNLDLSPCFLGVQSHSYRDLSAFAFAFDIDEKFQLVEQNNECRCQPNGSACVSMFDFKPLRVNFCSPTPKNENSEE